MPENTEPTVLDYLQSVFRDRKAFLNFVKALLGLGAPPAVTVTSREAEAVTGSKEATGVLPPRFLPWRSLLALAFALAGQRAFEPPRQHGATLGLVLYLIALGWLAWGLFRDEWRLASHRSTEEAGDSLTLTLGEGRLLGLALFAALLAFLDFKGNLFTWHNLTLWGLSLVLLFLALWVHQPGEMRQKIALALNRQHTLGKMFCTGLLIALVIGVVLFFRLYRLDQVLIEPFSDHAEKILDVYEITQGQYRIFFPRNSGREAFQMYWTLLIARVFHSGFTFFSLKLGTALLGILMLPYLYFLGKEIANKRVGALAVLFAGMGYWPNVISRVGLRFPLYPVFTAPTLYYLLRGLRTRNRNDFLLSGLFLGLGLHGYSPFRVIPLLVVLAIGLYLLHAQSRGARARAVIWLSLLALTALFVFLPLLRYMTEKPGDVLYRTLTRIGSLEQPLPGPVWKIFLSNVWNGLKMFNWYNGEIWSSSIPYRPALDVVSGALFILGAVLVLVRYLRQRHWLDLFLLLSIPLLSLPSTLALAFPNENPALNRAGGAFIPVFLLVALALDGLLSTLEGVWVEGEKATGRFAKRGVRWAWALMTALLFWSATQNFDLVFRQYHRQFRLSVWNTAEMAAVIRSFGKLNGTVEPVWIVPYPHWVDTRLPATWLGIPNRDMALWREQLEMTTSTPPPKMFLFKPEDLATQETLQALYPQGLLKTYHSAVEGRDFMIFLLP